MVVESGPPVVDLRPSSDVGRIPESGQIWPTSGQFWSIQGRVWSNFVDTTIGRNRPNCGRFGPNWSILIEVVLDYGQNWSPHAAKLGRIRPSFSRNRPNVGRSWTSSAGVGRIWVKFGPSFRNEHTLSCQRPWSFRVAARNSTLQSDSSVPLRTRHGRAEPKPLRTGRRVRRHRHPHQMMRTWMKPSCERLWG